jgi:hypothetical protein
VKLDNKNETTRKNLCKVRDTLQDIGEVRMPWGVLTFPVGAIPPIGPPPSSSKFSLIIYLLLEIESNLPTENKILKDANNRKKYTREVHEGGLHPKQ